MANRDIEKRLDELEKVIKSQDDSPIWIDGNNNVIRIDKTGRRGEEIIFPTTFAAVRWLEKQIDVHPAAAGSYSVDNICDVFWDGEELKDIILKIIPNPIVIQRRNNPIVGGVEKPSFFSADEFPATLFGRLKTTQPADMNLWLLTRLITQYFGNLEFRERYQNGVVSDDDINLNFVFYIIYGWDKEEISLNNFSQLFHQLVKLTNTKSEKEPVYK